MKSFCSGCAIGFAGVGGIGSNVAVNLVRAGIDNLKLVDFDRVEKSNLNRQFYFYDQIGELKVVALQRNLLAIRPDLRLSILAQRITAANIQATFADCDVVVEGFDQESDKKMLLEHCTEKKIVVSACGISGSELSGIRQRRIGNCLIAGDFSTDCRHAPLFSHKVLTVANYMTEAILARYP